MKKAANILLFSFIFFSCEKEYDEEIFSPRFQKIYGEWDHVITKGGWRNDYINTDTYFIRFVPIGIFYNRDGKKDVISIYKQENILILSFNNSLGKGKYKEIGFCGNDSMIIRDCGADFLSRLYVRKVK